MIFYKSSKDWKSARSYRWLKDGCGKPRMETFGEESEKKYVCSQRIVDNIVKKEQSMWYYTYNSQNTLEAKLEETPRNKAQMSPLKPPVS